MFVKVNAVCNLPLKNKTKKNNDEHPQYRLWSTVRDIYFHVAREGMC